jgi:hypothetical protein
MDIHRLGLCGARYPALGPRVHGFIPLSANRDFPRSDTASRLRTFVDAYGLDENERRQLVPMLGPRTRSMHDFLKLQSATGAEPWSTLWREGHGMAWNSDADWIEQRHDQWTNILLD